MNAVLFRHVFLELCEEPVDEREVLACLFVGLWLGLAPTDLKMATGAMVILALGFPALKKGKEERLHLRGI
jgi:hypothetical protein